MAALGSLLLLVSLVLLVGQTAAFVFGIALFRHMRPAPDKPANGSTLLRILVIVSAANVVGQVLTVWRVVLLDVDPYGSLVLRMVNLLLVQVLTGGAALWALIESLRLSRQPSVPEVTLPEPPSEAG